MGVKVCLADTNIFLQYSLLFSVIYYRVNTFIHAQATKSNIRNWDISCDDARHHHQNIFEEPEDFYQFINILDRMRTQYDDEGNSCGTNCIYYAYCLMSNHFHLLIRERDEKVGDTIKRIAGAYVYCYSDQGL